MPILIGVSIFAVFLNFAWYLIVGEQTVLLALLGLIFLGILVFKVTEEFLPLLLMITLAMGSAYRYDIAMKSFYLRFVVLGLIAVRGLFQGKTQNSEGKRNRFTPIHICLLFFSLSGVLLSFNSIDVSISVQRAVSFVLLYIVIFFYFWNHVKKVSDCEQYAISLWQSVALILSIGYIFLIVHRSDMFRAGRLRLVLGNPNQLGNYCAMMAPIAFWYWREKFGGKIKSNGFAVLLMIGVAILWSGSRAGLVGAALSLLLLTMTCYRKQLIFLIFGLIFIGSVQLLLGDDSKIVRPGDEGFFEQTVLRESQISTGSGRTDIWKAAVRLIHQRPWFGFGFGIVDRMFELGYFPELPTFQGGHVHNSYLEELVNLGWIGSILYFISLLYVLISGITFIVQTHIRDSQTYRLGIALFGTLVSGLVSSVFESWFTSVGSVFCFPFWLAAILFLSLKQFELKST